MQKFRSSNFTTWSATFIRTLLTLILTFLAANSTLASDDATPLPGRYLQLGLEPLNELFDFKYRSFRDGDRQSIIVRTRGREIYLLVFNQPINPRNIDVSIRSRGLRPGFTRACITTGSEEICPRIEAIYEIKNREHEIEVVKFLRAND